MRRPPAVLSLLALGAHALAQPAPGVQTPESVLGKRPGDHFYLANYEIAIISAPENLAKLDRYKEISRRLADGRGLDDAAARALAREGQAIVHLDGDAITLSPVLAVLAPTPRSVRSRSGPGK